MIRESRPRGRRLLRSLEALVFAHRVPVMALLLALTLLFAAQATQLRLATRFDAQFARDTAGYEVERRHRDTFGSADVLRIALSRPDGDIYDAAFLARLKAATEAVAALPAVDRPRLRSLFTPELRFVEVVEGGFFGSSVIPAAAAAVMTPANLAKIRANVQKSGVRGRYVSLDQRAAMIEAPLRALDPATGEAPEALAVARQVADALRPIAGPGDGIDVQIAGFAAQAAAQAAAAPDVLRLVLLSFALLLPLCRLATASWRLALLPWLAAQATLVWMLGLARLLGFALDPAALLLPLPIVATTLAQGLPFTRRWTRGVVREARSGFDASLVAWRRESRAGVAALVAGVLVCTLAALLARGALRDMAAVAALGWFASAVSGWMLLPIALSWLGAGRRPQAAAFAARRSGVAERLGGWLAGCAEPRAARRVLLAAAALLGAGLWFRAGGLPERATADGDRALAARFPYSGERLLAIVAEAEADACRQPEVLAQVDALAWQLDNTPGVVATDSLPQQVRRVYTAFSEGSPKFRTIPHRAEALQQAIAPITPASGLLNADCSAMPVQVVLADTDAATLRRVQATVDAFERDNAAEFFATHADVDARACEARRESRRVPVSARPAGDAPPTTCPVHFVGALGPGGARAARQAGVASLAPRLLAGGLGVALLVAALLFRRGAAVAGIALTLVLVAVLAGDFMVVVGLSPEPTTLLLLVLALLGTVDATLRLQAALAEAGEGHRSRPAGGAASTRSLGFAPLVPVAVLAVALLPWFAVDAAGPRLLAGLCAFVAVVGALVAVLLLPACAALAAGEGMVARREVGAPR